MLSDTVEEALINETQPKESKEMDKTKQKKAIIKARILSVSATRFSKICNFFSFFSSSCAQRKYHTVSPSFQCVVDCSSYS